MSVATSTYLQNFQALLSMPRETLPQLTAPEARKALRWAAEALGLEFVEIEGVAPTFLLLPEEGTEPGPLVFAAWHAEALPVDPAAVEGAERLALSVALAGLGHAFGARSRSAVIVTPGATQGSLVLLQTLREHRPRLRASAAFWPRIAPRAPRRRRIFLGARGRVVLGIWEAGVNAFRLRDRIIEELKAEAYGPRPLDFELLHKLGSNRDALDFLEETIDDPGAFSGEGEGEALLTRALFQPRGQVVTPQVRHPDRPQAWLILEITENASPEEVQERVGRAAGGAKIEMAEGFPWDRISIHHPSIQAQIKVSKTVSEGPEIWPATPWMTPSGVFTRALGTPLAEWGIPIDPSVAIRFPKPEQFEALAAEAGNLIRQGLEEAPS
jgi:hypothetical protein